MTIALETRDLHKAFGGLVATNGVNLSLPAGARHALIGPNGAGKTTFVNLLSGVLKPTTGHILLNGVDVTEWPPHQRARGGLARTFQINQLFSELTPLETITLTLSEANGSASNWWKPLGARSDLVEEAADLLSQLGLKSEMQTQVQHLPYGKQRLLEIAIAVAAKPTVLLLDEPAAGVPEAERHQILDLIASLPVTVSLILIEHDMDLVFRFAKTISVLVNGALFVEGKAEDIANDPRVRKVYLGESLDG